MRKYRLFCVIAFWILLAIREPWMTLWLGISMSVYLGYQCRRLLPVWIVLLILACAGFSQEIPMPQAGLYRIVQVHAKYSIGYDGDQRVVIYGLKDPQFDDVYLLESFQKIESLKNISLFQFDEYMKQEGIGYSSQASSQQLQENGRSIKTFLYRWLQSKSPEMTSFLYNLHREDSSDLIRRLSLPLLSLLNLIEMGCRRIFSKRVCLVLVFVLSLISGYLFVFTTSLVFFGSRRLAKLFAHHPLDQCCLTLMIFLILNPGKAASFAFVLPICMMITYTWPSTYLRRWIWRKWLLLGLQLIYFHEIDWVLWFIYGWLRKWSGLVLALGVLGLCIPVVNIPLIWIHFVHFVPSVIWQLDAGFVYIVIWLITGLLFLQNQSKWICIGSIVSLFACTFIIPYVDPFFTVTMFSIGQGDCTLIVEPFLKSAVLIDCGQNLHRDNMEEIVVPYLRLKHIEHLDAVIVTHDDFDHSGGLESLRKHISIGTIITTSNQSVPVSYPFENLLEDRHARDENEKSILNFFAYDGHSYLWMGDASVDVERQLLFQYPLLKADILKLGHHGSKTSSSFEFLDHMNPKLSLISVGIRNRYGHPDTVVLKRLRSLGISNLKTSEVGMIQLKSLYGLLFFRTGAGDFGIIPP